MSQPDVASYQLSPTDSAHIFNTKIVPADIDPFPTSPTHSTRPYALLTLGQTGAGKTLLVPPLLAALKRNGRDPAHLIADVYKTYHPEYYDLPSRISSQVCSKDARIWLEQAVRMGCDRKVDMLIESACRQPEDFIGLVRILQKSDYEINVVVLAVPYALSRLGILVRYFERLPESGSRGLGVRLTPTKVHDDSYEGLLEAAKWLDEEGAVDSCVVLRRGNLVGFVAARNKDERVKGGVAEALRRERERPLMDKEREVASEGLERLARVSEAEGALAQVKKLLEPLLVSEEVPQGQFPELRSLKLNESDKVGNVLNMSFADPKKTL